MPIYEYRCQDCEQIFEEWQKDFKEREVSCPVCNARAERLISSTSFILKGTGWYVTDYCKRSESGGASASSGGNSAKSAATSDAAAPAPAAAPATPAAPAASAATASAATAD
ncbi:FmdB family zinc ribbon protein [Megalodesulfovibrio gigas]|uniref:Putative regulatory protein, FmdB family n=1 Tax=Megalodesulfovibrio gigas (strain ATCC 19364 / DSM 1382 / NCIMB 9332 / VKM B-1759) TaxID=1121448 RepID=T2GA22_MEGG1|nr:zinc ribbon domain-containing protein [Megalodesulfovibrio gigas]AGW13024.1 putative regulatory protein, FmdB family [Megalodesulfovibrio gigas DSM 1382 = ATCC 19364]